MFTKLDIKEVLAVKDEEGIKFISVKDENEYNFYKNNYEEIIDLFLDRPIKKSISNLGRSIERTTMGIDDKIYRECIYTLNNKDFFCLSTFDEDSLDYSILIIHLKEIDFLNTYEYELYYDHHKTREKGTRHD